MYLWPVTVNNATLLCGECNNAKHEKWPAEFYNQAQLRHLSVLTGISLDTLAGPAMLNPAAVESIRADVDSFLARWIQYPDDIKRIRRLILRIHGKDIFEYAKTVPDFLRDEVTEE